MQCQSYVYYDTCNKQKMTLFCHLGYLLSKTPTIGHILENRSRYMTAVVYIGLGSYILWKNGTLTHISVTMTVLISY
jgi:cadmium resistance protein CadD (predicted permease)